MVKTAVISGCGGQVGSYLAEYLLELGYRVVGIVRRTATPSHKNIQHLIDADNKFITVEGDITDRTSMASIVQAYRPDEFYNQAAFTHVGSSWKQPDTTLDITGVGALNILEAIRVHHPECRFYQASTSELFSGKLREALNEDTPFAPASPYGAAKYLAHNLVSVYREGYGLYACAGICFNMESPRRGEDFVTRKITRAIAEIKAGKIDEFGLGNLDVWRDWSFAGDNVKAMHLMLQQVVPTDYVIGSGETHALSEFLELAFQHSGLGSWKEFVYQDPAFMRPVDVPYLLSDPSRIKKDLGWEAETSFTDLVKMMVDADIAAL